jgi:hypothetical protein
LEDVSNAHRTAAREAEKQGNAADALARRQGNATLQAARGMEQLVRSASGTGSALDTIFAQVSQLAFGFGPAGPLIGAVAVAGIAIVEIFENTKREMVKAIDTAEKEFKRLAKAGDREAIKSRIKELVGGDRFGESDEDVAGIEGARARRKQLDAERAALLAQHPELKASAGVVGGGIARMIGSDIAATIARASDEIRDLDTFLQKVTPEVVQLRGRLKELNTENAARDEAKGFEDWFKQQERLLKGLSLAGELTAGRVGQLFDESKAWRTLASTLDVTNPKYERFLALAKTAGDLAERQRTLPDTATRAASAIAGLLPKIDGGAAGREARGGVLAGLLPDPTELGKEIRFTLDLAMDSIKNDPLVAFTKAAKGLAEQMRHALSSTLGEGIVAGFESAFSGKGIGDAFKTLTATVLGGLGSFMEQLGAQMIVIGFALDALAASLLSLNGPAAIAAGVALIAAGAGLKAIAGSFGGGSSSSAGGGSFSGGAAPSFLTFGVQASSTPTTSQQAPNAKPYINIGPIIGANDPRAQRDIGALVENSVRRGLVPSIAG